MLASLLAVQAAPSLPAAVAWLVTCSLKAALVLACAWLANVVARRASAAARHHLWTLGIVGSLLVPLVSSLPLAVPIGSRAASSLPVIGASMSSASGAGSAVASDVAVACMVVCVVAWALGVLLLATRFARGHVAARALWRGGVPLSSSPSSPSSSSGVQVRISDRIGSPITIGVLRSRILLPAAAIAWPPDRMRAVLLHEVAHVRRRDTLVQCAAQLACALYWWNPLVWLASSRMRVEREHACDDEVLAAGVPASSYASDLLAIARALDRVALVGVGIVDPSSTEARLRRILDARAPRGTLGVRARMVLRAGALALVVAVGVTAPAIAAVSRVSLGAPYTFADGYLPDSVDDLPPPLLAADDPADPLVMREVRSHLGDLERCYERRRREHPGLAGTVLIHWSIGASGGVDDQCISEDTVNDPALASCVNKVIESSHFAPPPDGKRMNISLPFAFGG